MSAADDMIRSYFDRWQRLEEEKRAISDDLKELFAEAKGNGLDSKALRTVFREQVGDKAAMEEFDAICDLYRASLTAPRARPAPARVEKIEKFDAETGEITEQPETARKSLGTGDDGNSPSNGAVLLSTPQGAGMERGIDRCVTAGETAPIPDDDVPAFLKKDRKTAADYRPHCQHPEACGSSGLHHCYTCQKAIAAESEAA